jgi:ZIP family zinc transporter
VSQYLVIFIPVVVAILGAVATTMVKPGPLFVSAVQHLAAGVVFAAAAAEVLPDLKHAGAVLPVVIGGGLGVAVMLFIKWLEERVKGPIGLLTIVGVDLFIDGLVLGLSFLVGERAGFLLTVALTLEVLFLGVVVASRLEALGGKAMASVLSTTGLVLLMPLGSVLAFGANELPAGVVTGLFAFGLVALLYLVTEELLVEAHEVPDRPWITALFFVGFLALLVLDELMAA